MGSDLLEVHEQNPKESASLAFEESRPERYLVVVLFLVSMFLSSALLFLLEPMIAKMLLPLLGGTASVWNTCLVFFQAMLLAGYLYADISSKRLSQKWQIVTHFALIASPFLCVGLLPIHLPLGWRPPAETSPSAWVLGVLLVSVGLPFFILSSTTPILQRWFMASGHPDGADPYFLYAASNAGSLAGLIAYPFVVEPFMRLRAQSATWSVGYGVFVAFAAACALLTSRHSKTDAIAIKIEEPVPLISGAQRVRWMALAFVPSSLVLGITTSLTTDFPAIPMVWVLTLAAYLLTFVLVFAKRPPIPHEWLAKREPFLILVAMLPIVSKTRFPFPVMLALGLLVLFGLAMICHGEIARTRPATRHLTEFYLWISVGGVLGGIFNALVAPVLFRSVVELPLVLILAAALREPTSAIGFSDPRARRNDWLLPIALGVCMFIALAIMGSRPGHSLTIMIFGYSLLWCLSFAKRRFRFVGGLVALCLASSFNTGPFGRVLHTERSFFGVSRVTTDPLGRFHYLIHGGTAHGIERMDSAHVREPLSYYAGNGPGGQIFHAAQAAAPQGDWAIVGLGAGAMACYLQPGQTLTYYEIDPVVTRIAKNPQYFQFLGQCAPNVRVVLGDARLSLNAAPDAQYGLIALDAFSGDSIPMHLVTREALSLYQRKLAPHGIIAFHISNLYLDLSQPLKALAQDAHLACLIEHDTAVSQSEMDAGRYPSTWVVMARQGSDLSDLISANHGSARWLPIGGHADTKVWTDDYSDLLSTMRWRF